MTLRLYVSILLFLLAMPLTYGQMIVGQDTLIGNEWIRYGQKYFKFLVAQDGVYRISTARLQEAGISPSDIQGAQLRIYNMGQQVPLYVTTEGQFGTDDYIEFFGRQNRGALDHFLFRRPELDMLNPDYSMYTDTNAYFLAYEGVDIPLRTNTIENNISNPPPQEEFYLHHEKLNFHSDPVDPYFPLSEGGSISYSSYMHGEGFGKANEVHSTTPINSSNVFLSGPDAILHVRFATTNWGPHSYIVSFNDQPIDTIELTNQQISDNNYTIPLSSLTDNNQLKLIAENVISRHSVIEVDLLYPRTPTVLPLSTVSVNLHAQTGDQFYVLGGFPLQGQPPIIYTQDGKNRMIAAIDVLNNIMFRWPQTLTDIQLHIIDPVTAIQSITGFEEKIFVDLSGDDTEYIVITHPELMEAGTENAYIQYRMSAAGGSYKAKAYSILDLYDQFGYGIQKHPQAIRNFVEFFDDAWPSAKMIFIVGRAIEYTRARNPGAWEEAFFVPTFGRPGSDNLLAATLWDLVPRFPIGRLAIIDPQPLQIYLDKAKEHDASKFAGQSIEEKEWIKNVMHLGGGKTASEQNEFKATLGSLGEDLAKSDYGAKVHFFQKTSTDQIGESLNAQILKLLNQGCGIINYLGHSASSTFEFNINDPSEWNNHGRYPVFSAMGCSAGQIHGTLFSLSDNYTQIPNEGVVAFISGSGSQFAAALVGWARPWYDYIGNVGYGGTLGESILYGLEAISNYVNPELNVQNHHRFLLEQQTFQGDPALRFHPFPGPDYLVDRKSVSIHPEILNTKLDSFDVSFSIVNIGRNLRQEVAYKVSIRRPDGQMIEVNQGLVSSNDYDAVITVRLPLDTDDKPGSFRLLIEVDPNNMLAELPSPEAESNNNLTDNLGVEGIEFFVVDNLISAAYPPDFSIVTQTTPELIATSSNSFVKRQDIVIEIDTTALFNSPSLLREKFIDHSATLKWSPSFNYVPDRVYYWRVSTDSISPEQGYLWSKRSFIYKPGTQNGWNQSHFYQFTDNTLNQLRADSTRRDFTFGSRSRNFNILNRYHEVALGLIPKVTIDGVIRAEFFTGFRDKNVQAFVVVIDSLTGEYLLNPNPGLYGSANHLSYPAKVFPYRMDVPESRQALINFVEDVVKPGDYVFFYTYQRPAYPSYYPEQWDADEAVFGKSIFTMIENQYPSSAIRTLATTGSKPYIVFFQKDRGGIVELIAADTSDVISYSYDIQLSLDQGEYLSPLIGPSQRWYSILNQTNTMAADTAGENILSAWALSADFSDTLTISTNLTSLDTSIADIDAKKYPFIQLSYTTQDSVTYNPSDIVFWRVLYDGYPEIIINPDLGFVYHADTLEQGETMRLSTYIENVSDYDVDSLTVALRITSEDHTTEELNNHINQLNAHSSEAVDFQKVTTDMSGQYSVLMEVNPGRAVNETNYGNNIGILPLFVVGDRLNPILDVTFDGHHILDGDLVSSRPVISIQLHDENQYLRLDDTSTFAIFLEYPSEFEPRQISFTEDWVQFIQAGASGQNIATVELRPELLEDGIYTLQIRARDASGNFAGDNDYLISFEVINAESISHLYNYPNPFSTATRFVYTLTGAESPPYYKIQIMSLSGKVVREITQDELGPLTVGTHMTDYVWNGTDENGDKLAAGTYIYRMIVKDNELKDFDHYETRGEETHFKKGWGKLVILR